MLQPCGAEVPAMQQSINISYLMSPQQQTRCTLLQQANWTDRWTPYNFIDPAPHTMWAV